MERNLIRNRKNATEEGIMGILKYQPTCEQEVIALFCGNLENFGLKIIRLRTTKFPDCIAEDLKTGEETKIEFELFSNNFHKHKHNCSECDCVICWLDDAVPSLPVRIIELCRMPEFENLPVNESVARKGANISQRIIALASKREGISLGDFEKMIDEFHEDVRSSESRLLIARMISGKGKPYIENGRLHLREAPSWEEEQNKWAVASDKVLMKKADNILSEFGYKNF